MSSSIISHVILLKFASSFLISHLQEVHKPACMVPVKSSSDSYFNSSPNSSAQCVFVPFDSSYAAVPPVGLLKAVFRSLSSVSTCGPQ